METAPWRQETSDCKQAVIEFLSNEIVDYRLLSQSDVGLGGMQLIAELA
jgi:hypothetical protein